MSFLHETARTVLGDALRGIKNPAGLAAAMMQVAADHLAEVSGHEDVSRVAASICRHHQERANRVRGGRNRR